MTGNDVRSRLEAAWLRIDRDAESQRSSHSALFALEALYREISNEDRPAASQVIIGWAQSRDAKKRFDGLALIDQFLIVEALPVLRTLARGLESSTEPSAPYERAKLLRIISRLMTQTHG